MRTSNRIRTCLLAGAIPALIPMVSLAQTVIAPPASATLPAAGDGVAATQGVNGKILVLPFMALNPNDASAWMGKSIQESLVADLTVSAPDRVVSGQQIAPSVEAALNLARQNGARFVVAGGFASSGQQLRITGQVLDVQTGKPITGLKATGEPSQIFGMEDSLAMQVKSRVIPGAFPAAVNQAARGQQGPASMPPGSVNQQPAAAYQPPASAYDPAPITYGSSAPAYQPAPDESTGVRTDAGPAPTNVYYNSYAAPEPQVVYGADPNAYVYSQPVYYPYSDYVAPAYVAPYCGFGYGFGLGYSPFYDSGFGFGLGLGYFAGGGWRDGNWHHGDFDHDHWDADRGNRNFGGGRADFHGSANGRSNGGFANRGVTGGFANRQARTSLGSSNIASGAALNRATSGHYAYNSFSASRSLGSSHPAFRSSSFASRPAPYRSQSYVGRSFSSARSSFGVSRSLGAMHSAFGGGGGGGGGHSFGGGGHSGGGGGGHH